LGIYDKNNPVAECSCGEKITEKGRAIRRWVWYNQENMGGERMTLRKRLVLGAALALLLTAMMGMLAYLSGAHRQLAETYEVQAALLAERMEQLQEKEAELAALEEKNNALAADLEGRYAKAEELLDDDGFWGQLLACYDDPLQTDWLPENVRVSVQGKVGE
jgi:hypothetical protein